MSENKIINKHRLIALCADRGLRAGEADSALSLNDELLLHAKDPDHYYPHTHFYKVSAETKPPFSERDRYAHWDGHKQYAPFRDLFEYDDKMIGYSSHYMSAHEVDSTALLGIGHSTLPALVNMCQSYDTRHKHVDSAQRYFVTHDIDKASDLALLVDNNITLFKPTGLSMDRLAALDPVKAVQLQYIDIPAIPHTNTPVAIANEYAKFQKYSHDFYDLIRFDHNLCKTVTKFQAEQTPFISVVVNAGFPNAAGGRDCYTLEEAAAQGAALGQQFPFPLIAYEGGPRNGQDAAILGEKASTVFIKNFCASSGVNEDDCILVPFNKKELGNPVKVALALANNPLCRAFISNAEGYGTMDGACSAIDNTRANFTLGMMPFNAVMQNQGKRENMELYFKKGVAKLWANDDGGLRIEKPPGGAVTPIELHNTAHQILQQCGVTTPTMKKAAPQVNAARLYTYDF